MTKDAPETPLNDREKLLMNKISELMSDNAKLRADLVPEREAVDLEEIKCEFISAFDNHYCRENAHKSMEAALDHLAASGHLRKQEAVDVMGKNQDRAAYYLKYEIICWAWGNEDTPDNAYCRGTDNGISVAVDYLLKEDRLRTKAEPTERDKLKERAVSTLAIREKYPLSDREEKAVQATVRGVDDLGVRARITALPSAIRDTFSKRNAEEMIAYCAGVLCGEYEMPGTMIVERKLMAAAMIDLADAIDGGLDQPETTASYDSMMEKYQQSLEKHAAIIDKLRKERG